MIGSSNFKEKKNKKTDRFIKQYSKHWKIQSMLFFSNMVLSEFKNFFQVQG